jgi:hypothetical protein
MSPRATRLVFAAQLGALAAMAAALLLRDTLAIGWHVPLDPNEGWNAYHAAAGLRGLYPPPGALMVNNYPPLSFPLVAALGGIMGDDIIAGRILSLFCFVATGMGIAWLLRHMGCRRGEALFGALVFAGGLLIGSDYVAMNDPQLLGHALQVAGLILLLREQVVAAALLLVGGIFVKHNLLALPLAAALWLYGQDRTAALRFAAAGLGFGVIGLVLLRLCGVNLLAELASPRLYAFANFRNVSWRFLQWSAAAIEFSAWLAWRWRRDRLVCFAALYGASALAIGFLFAGGDGVDANIFFDAAIALALTAGLIQNRFGAYGRAVAATAIVVPLALCLWMRFADDNFAYTRQFRQQAPRDIAFLAQGPALCEQLSLCYWAGEKVPADVFNLGEAIATGKRTDADIVQLLETRHFRSLQFDSLESFALGARVRAALLKNYRLDHEDDNGLFFRPR